MFISDGPGAFDEIKLEEELKFRELEENMTMKSKNCAKLLTDN